MSTLHQRVQFFYSKGKYRFKPWHQNVMGQKLKKIFNKYNPYDPPPPLVESIEEKGTFQVTDYPEHFTPYIDSFIVQYMRDLSEKSKAYHAKQKPLQKKSPPYPSVSDAAPAKRVRKRIPIKTAPNNPLWKSN